MGVRLWRMALLSIKTLGIYNGLKPKTKKKTKTVSNKSCKHLFIYINNK